MLLGCRGIKVEQRSEDVGVWDTNFFFSCPFDWDGWDDGQ